MYKMYVTKKNIGSLLEKPVYRFIEEQSIHHSGIMDIAIRLTELAGAYLPSGKSKYIDITLSEAMTNWGIASHRHGINQAYSDYCQTVFESLSQIYNYSVTGKTKIVPHFDQTWDCTSLSFYEWVNANNIDCNKLTVEYNPVAHRIDMNATRYILSSRVFSRNDMVFLGLSSEIHKHTGS